MTKPERFAKVIRIVTMPPILIILMLTFLYLKCPYVYNVTRDYSRSLIWLGVFPVLAYPLQAGIPKWKEKGREGRRTLAFICSVIGYSISIIYGEIAQVSYELKIIYITYFISVILLVVFNRIFKIRASGHACSITGPFIFLVFYYGWNIAYFPIAIGALSFWAALKLKSHISSDLVTGSVVCFASFGIAILL